MLLSVKALKRLLLVIIIIFGAGTVIINSPSFWKLFYPLPYREAVNQRSKQFQLDPFLVAAVMRVESKFNPYAESRRGARGLMQLMPDTARWAAGQMGLSFSEDKLLEPDYNILLGCWYLANLESEFKGNIVLTLAAYNAGRGNVRQWVANEGLEGEVERIEQIPFPETREFVRRVLADFERYQWIYGREAEDLARALDLNPTNLGKNSPSRGYKEAGG